MNANNVEQFLKDNQLVDELYEKIRQVVGSYCGVLLSTYPDGVRLKSVFTADSGYIWTLESEGPVFTKIECRVNQKTVFEYRRIEKENKKSIVVEMDKPADVLLVFQGLSVFMHEMEREYSRIASWRYKLKSTAEMIRSTNV